MDDLIIVPLDHGASVILHIEKLLNSLGAYGLRVGTDGALEALMVKPEGTTWEAVEDLPAVIAGQTATTRPRRSN